MKNILGFDISSTCIGYCYLQVHESSGKIKFISCGYIKPIKKGNIIERLSNTRDKIVAILEKVQPDIIAIEDIIQFMSGASTAKTIITLTSFNRMIGLLCYDYLSKSPDMYSVMSIRHALKLNKIFPKKEDMPELVSTHLGIKFPYEKNKNGKIKTENYDMADSVAVALYSALLLTNKIKSKKK